MFQHFRGVETTHRDDGWVIYRATGRYSNREWYDLIAKAAGVSAIFFFSKHKTQTANLNQWANG
jgi:hypothetical protein